VFDEQRITHVCTQRAQVAGGVAGASSGTLSENAYADAAGRLEIIESAAKEEAD
jgi:hypothetical protein